MPHRHVPQRPRPLTSLLPLLLLLSAAGCDLPQLAEVRRDPFVVRIWREADTCSAAQRTHSARVRIANRGLHAKHLALTVRPAREDVALLAEDGRVLDRVALEVDDLAVGAEKRAGELAMSIPCEIAFHPDLFHWQIDSTPFVPPTVSPPDVADSLRVLTYNVAFLAATVDLPFPFPDQKIQPNDKIFGGLAELDRADAIADAILRGDQDVVVLNEVFDDEIRARLVARLMPTYPHFVAKLQAPPVKIVPSISTFPEWAGFPIPLPDIPGIGENTVVPADSGLMLFSRHPFLPLVAQPGAPGNDTQCSESTCQAWGLNQLAPLTPSHFAFTRFDDCEQMDCFASKGAGLVRVDAPAGPVLVAFTHLQADYSDAAAYVQLRIQQMLQIEALLQGHATPLELASEHVVLAGDFNVPGRNQDQIPPSEWKTLFQTGIAGDLFFACGDLSPCDGALGSGRLLTDAWGFETSTADPGFSSVGHHKRLDFLLHNRPTRSCMQRVQIAWDLAEDGVRWYSDHLPVRIDLNTRGRWCTPNLDAPAFEAPERVTFPGTDCGDPGKPCAPDQGYGPAEGATIVRPGHFQWFTIEQPGAYSIVVDPAVAGEDVAFEVYHESDLSRPIRPVTDVVHPDWGVKFALLEPPYYIRTFAVDAAGAPDRTAHSRGYFINFHQHLCRSVEDSCYLPAGAVEYPYHWPATTPYTQVETLYFQFETSGVAEGRLLPTATRFPLVRIQQEAPWVSTRECLLPLAFEEYDVHSYAHLQSHPTAAHEVAEDDDFDMDGYADERFVAGALPGKTADALAIYYAVMHRDSSVECEPSMTTWTRFETDLTWLELGRATGFVMARPFPMIEDDVVGFGMFWDDPQAPSRPFHCLLLPCPTRTYDPHTIHTMTGVAGLEGYYIDEVVLELYEMSEGRFELATGDTGPSGGIDTLHPWEARSDSQLILTDEPDPEDADYLYHVQFLQCREKDDCLWPQGI